MTARGRRSPPTPARDRVFLDANVLFSAAYREGSALARLWRIPIEPELVSTSYAAEEAGRNLADPAAGERLSTLIAAIRTVPDVADAPLPDGVELPAKDRPILLAAVACGATHLLTGDRTHFGVYFGRRIGGVLVERPGDYLRRAAAGPGAPAIEGPV